MFLNDLESFSVCDMSFYFVTIYDFEKQYKLPRMRGPVKLGIVCSSCTTVNLVNLKLSRKADTIKKHCKPYMAKKAIVSCTQGRKNKVLKRTIYLTGINKEAIVDK